MGRGTEWVWTKASVIHPPDASKRVRRQCRGALYSYVYRYYPPDSPSYERCIGLAWCSTCRTYTGNMVFVPRDEVLLDALAGLASHERDTLSRSEVRLLDHLDRLVRRGTWPPAA
jgi:hypothetical protein